MNPRGFRQHFLDLRQPAINVDFSGVNKARVVRGQESHRFSHFFRLANAAQRDVGGQHIEEPLTLLWGDKSPRPGVRTGPGLTTFTRIARAFRSSAHERARLRTAALLALYTLKFAVPFTAAVEPVRMMEAPWVNSGKAFWTVNSTPRTLVAKMRSKCSSVMAPSGIISPPPALAKSTSTRPDSLAMVENTLSRSLNTEASARIPLAAGPINATAASSSS